MCILVTKEAPDFVAPAVLGDGAITEQFRLSNHRGRHVVLFFWPLDFTFFCPAGWQNGDAGMVASAEDVADYLTRHAEAL